MLLFLILLLLGGCSLTDVVLGPRAEVRYSRAPYAIRNGFGKHYYRPETRYRLRHSHANGIASYYGGSCNGQETASRVIFDENQLTAAHPTAVIPSIAHITNIDNGKSVYVIITDRGPYAYKRICDLSVAAAKKLEGQNKIRKGLYNIKITILPDQTRILARYWKKFVHKKLPSDLFKHIHNKVALRRYLEHMYARSR